MKFTIGKFDQTTGTVPVTFSHAGVNHSRPVNGVRKDNGSYDAAGTRERVLQVANGVEYKINIGVITNPIAN